MALAASKLPTLIAGWYYPLRRDLAAAPSAPGDQADARREADAALAYRTKDPDTLALRASLRR